jgi:hypothetical protein
MYKFFLIKKIEITFLKSGPAFSLREGKRNQKKVAKEYCWAITKAEGRSCCG